MRQEPVQCLCLGKKQHSGFGCGCGRVIYRLAVRGKWCLLSRAVRACSSLLLPGLERVLTHPRVSSKGTNPKMPGALTPAPVCVAGSAPPDVDHFLKTLPLQVGVLRNGVWGALGEVTERFHLQLDAFHVSSECCENLVRTCHRSITVAGLKC